MFEIVFPRQMRGKHASVGIGLKKAALVSDSNKTLVGSDEHSWGVDLVTKEVCHNKRKIGKFPGLWTSFPDRFYMYIDMDVGSLLFGQEDRFFGSALTDEHLIGSVVYPMVSATQTGAAVTVVYRGKGNTPQTSIGRVYRSLVCINLTVSAQKSLTSNMRNNLICASVLSCLGVGSRNILIICRFYLNL